MKLYDGMRVKGKIFDDKFVGVITEEDGKFYICQNVRNGESCKEKKGFKYSWCIGDGSKIDTRINNASDLYPLDDSIENIYVGAIVVEIDGSERKVLGNVDEVWSLSRAGAFDRIGILCTISELKSWGLKLCLEPEPKKPVREVTMKEVCEKFGYDVKIRKED